MTGEAPTTPAGALTDVGEKPAAPADAPAYTVIKPKARAIGATSAVALWGLSGTVIAVEASINNGLPGIDIVGLPDASVSEARKRVRAAVSNVGLSLSAQRITVNLSPGSVKKAGTAFDLSIAVALLAAEGAVNRDSAASCVCIGELGLDGRLHPVNGVLPMVSALRKEGLRRVIVPKANESEALLAGDVDVRGCISLADAVRVLGGDVRPVDLVPVELSGRRAVEPQRPGDLADVQGQDDARWALEVAAAGGHHLLMSGPPGAGKTMLAGCLPGLLPPLSPDEAVEACSLQSLDGTLDPERGLAAVPPFESPHHRTTAAAMVGGSKPGMIGVLSKAHRGVLFLDEAPEFSRDVLEAMRQPLESGVCSIHRAWGSVDLPAQFQLVLAANPCPCGGSTGRQCMCSPTEKRRYRAKLSGPLMDRVDIQLTVQPISPADLHRKEKREASAEVAQRVAQARQVQAERYSTDGFSLNARAPGSRLREIFHFTPQETAHLDTALERGTLSMRGYDRVLRIAATIADLRGIERPSRDELMAAAALRTQEQL